jgi:hypothetical protein
LVSRRSLKRSFGRRPTLQWRLDSRIEEIVMANLERLDGFADDLLDGRLGFDRWPLRIPAEAPLRAR